MRTSEYVLENLLFVLIAVIFAYGIYSTVGLALGTDVPVVAVTSGSMEPALHRGDMIVVHGTAYEDIEVGDVLVYTTDEMPVPIIHRVIKKNASALETRGDNNRFQHAFERHVTRDEILGKAAFTVPYIGYFKLLPTCTYLRAQYGNTPRITYLCPPGEL